MPTREELLAERERRRRAREAGMSAPAAAAQRQSGGPPAPMSAGPPKPRSTLSDWRPEQIASAQAGVRPGASAADRLNAQTFRVQAQSGFSDVTPSAKRFTPEWRDPQLDRLRQENVLSRAMAASGAPSASVGSLLDANDPAVSRIVSRDQPSAAFDQRPFMPSRDFQAMTPGRQQAEVNRMASVSQFDQQRRQDVSDARNRAAGRMLLDTGTGPTFVDNPAVGMSAEAAARQAERNRQERREAAQVNMGDMIITQDAFGRLQPGTDVDRDIGKGILTAPVNVANAVISAGESAINLPIDAFNAMANVYYGTGNTSRDQRIGAPRLDVPEIPLPEELQSATGALTKGLAQFLIGRGAIGKALPGGGLAAQIGKDALTVGTVFDGSTGRIADMIDPSVIPEGPLRDYAAWLRTQPDDSELVGRFKNFLEDMTVSGPFVAPQVVVSGGRAINRAVNPPSIPTNAGGARLGPPPSPRQAYNAMPEAERRAVVERLQQAGMTNEEIVAAIRSGNTEPPVQPTAQQADDAGAASFGSSEGDALAQASDDILSNDLITISRNWDLANRNRRSSEWFDGSNANLDSRNGFDEALANGGTNLFAHGMAKEGTLSGGVENLLNLIRNGLDPARRGGKLDTNPLVTVKGSSAAFNPSTAGGVAYRDGPFILVARPGEELAGNLDGLGAVLVNQAHPEIIPMLREAIRRIRPDIIVEPYSNAGSVAARLNALDGAELRLDRGSIRTPPPQAAAPAAPAGPAPFSRPGDVRAPRGNLVLRNADRVVGGTFGGMIASPSAAASAGDDGSNNPLGTAGGVVAGALLPRLAAQAGGRTLRAAQRAAGGAKNANRFDERIASSTLRKQFERAGLTSPAAVQEAMRAAFGNEPATLADLTQEGLSTAVGLTRLPGSTAENAARRAAELADTSMGRTQAGIEDAIRGVNPGLNPGTIAGDVDELIAAAQAEASPLYRALRAQYPLGSLDSGRLMELLDQDIMKPHVQAAQRYRDTIAISEGRQVGDFEFVDIVKRSLDDAEQKAIGRNERVPYDLESARVALLEEMDRLVPRYAEARRLGGEAPRMRQAFSEGQRLLQGRFSVEDIGRIIQETTGAALTATQAGVIRAMIGKVETGRGALQALTGPGTRQKLARVFGQEAADAMQARFKAEEALMRNARQMDPNVGSVTSRAMLSEPAGIGPMIAEAVNTVRNPLEAGLAYLSKSGAYSQAQRDLMGEMLLGGATDANLARIFPPGRTRPPRGRRGGPPPAAPQGGPPPAPQGGSPPAGGRGPAAGPASAGPVDDLPRGPAPAAAQADPPFPDTGAATAGQADPAAYRGPISEQVGPWNGPVPKKPQSLIAWIKSQGGIKDTNFMTGDLRSIMGRSNGMPGLLNNKSGTALDELARKAHTEGFDVDPEDANSLMRLIDEEFGGNPSYRIGAREEWDIYQEWLAARRGDFDDPTSRSPAFIGGAGVGAVTGAAMNPDDPAAGALIGASVGGVGGAVAGRMLGRRGPPPRRMPPGRGVNAMGLGGGSRQIGGRGSAAERFSSAAIKRESRVADLSRSKLIEMPIDDFLQLAKKGNNDQKLSGVKSVLNKNESFESLPYLMINRDGSVRGHEGRHRARALKDAGYDTMPVIVRSENIRWSEQGNPNAADYVDEWPQQLTAEAGAESPGFAVPFPISREQATQPYRVGSAPTRASSDNIIRQAEAQGYRGRDIGEAQEWVRAREKGLDMSQPARMERARAMGFDTEQVLYHGTNKDFDKFIPGASDNNYGAGVYVTQSKNLASEYARGTDARILPLLIKKGKYANEDVWEKAVDRAQAKLDKAEPDAPWSRWHELATAELKKRGFLGVIGDNQTVIFDPANIRSVNAAFDPAEAGSRNILAGMGANPAATGALTVGAAGVVAPYDTDGDGVIDDNDRAAFVIGNMITGGVGGAVAGRLMPKAARRGPPTGPSTMGLGGRGASRATSQPSDVNLNKDSKLSEIIQRGRPIAPTTPTPTASAVASALADTRTSGAATSERLDIIVPEADRVVGGTYTPGAPGGGNWTDLSPDFLEANGPGFDVSDDELIELWRQSVQMSSQAAKNAVKANGVVPTFMANDWNEAMQLPYRDMLWYELSGEALGTNLPDLTAREFIHTMDVVGATSARAEPDDNLERTLSVISQNMQGRPIDVDLTQPPAVNQALSRRGLGSSALPGNKTGHFSDTLALTGGVPTRFPISVNDVWVGKMFGISDEVMSNNQSLHEPMAIYFNKIRDLYNRRHGAQITEAMRSANPQLMNAPPFNLQSWNFQAPAWVHIRGQATGDAYHQVWDDIIDKLNDAGIPGIVGQKITREALMHPGFADALRRTAGPWRNAPKATVEFGTKLTNVGKSARERYDRAVEAGDLRTQKEYLKPIMAAMYASARGKNKPWDLLKDGITGRKGSITRIDYGTQNAPLDVGGSFDGDLSPNIRIPLKGMTDDEIADFNAFVGEDLLQEAMAASQVLPANLQSASRPGYTRGISLFVQTIEPMNPSEIRALAKALDAEGHTISYNRYPNGYKFDINPNFGDDGVQTGIDSRKLEEAFKNSIGTSKYGTPKIIAHDYKSVYTVNTDYAGRIAAVQERIVDDFAKATGLSKARAKRDLSRTRAPSTYSGTDRRAWNTARRRVDNLASARAQFKALAEKVENGHVNFLERTARRDAQADKARQRGQTTLSAFPTADDAAIRQGPTFYSALTRAVERSPTKSAPASQWKSTLANSPGIKAEEIEWTGVNDWLDMQQGKIAREDLAVYLKNNGVRIEEKILGAGLIDTKYSEYTLPGGKNYTELLLKLPDDAPALTEKVEYLRDYLKVADELDLTAAEKAELRQELDVALEKRNRAVKFPPKHFNQPNVLAHVRFKERQVGNRRVLAIEEIQSDWHQAGREKGYDTAEWRQERERVLKQVNAELLQRSKRDNELYDQVVALARSPEYETYFAEAIKNFNVMGDEYQAAQRMAGRSQFVNGRMPDGLLKQRLLDLMKERDLNEIALRGLEARAHEASRTNIVPNAPFKNNAWASLSLKRMIRHAAENGFDEIAWVPGQVPVERFSLSKQIDSLSVTDAPAAGDDMVILSAYKNGRSVLEETIPRSKLKDYVGAEAAEKVLAKPKERITGARSLDGVDLNVGGAGMKAFYDQILVNEANKIGKKYGVKVSSIEVPLPDGTSQKMHSMTITPEVRKMALEGQPLFAFPGAGNLAQAGAGVGGAAYGYARGSDLNEDGVIDDQERMTSAVALGALGLGTAGLARMRMGMGRAKPPSAVKAGPPVQRPVVNASVRQRGAPKPPKGPPGAVSRMVAGGATGGAVGALAGEASGQDDLNAEIMKIEGKIGSVEQEIAALKKAKSDFEKITDPFEKQRFLKDKGLYPGNIDGNIKGLTSEAIKAWTANNASDLQKAESAQAQNRQDLENLRKQSAYRQFQQEQNPFVDALRELGPSGAAIVGGVAATVLRARGVGKSKEAVKLIEADINDLLTKGPVKSLLKKGGAANTERNRAVNMNQFYRQGGAPEEKLPFVYGSSGWKVNPKKAPVGSLYTPKTTEKMDGVGSSVLRPFDVKVIGAGLFDAALVTPFVEDAKEELRKAQEDVEKGNESIEALRRVEKAKTNVAMYEALQRLGLGVAGAGVLGLGYRYKLPKPDIRSADEEVTAISDFLRANAPPKPPRAPRASRTQPPAVVGPPKPWWQRVLTQPRKTKKP